MATKELTVWQQRVYGGEGLAKINKAVEDTEVDRKQLDALDEEIAQQVETPNSDMIKRWSRVASGIGNKLRKLAIRLEASVRNAESARYVEILFECEANGLKFTDGSAKADASNYVSEIRKARNLFLGYSEASDKILSTCRMHLNQQELNLTNDVSS